jgi:uncharacterized protein YjgD (DUF1641 family)
MTTPTLAPDHVAALEHKIDSLTEQVTFLAAEATERRRQREMFEELVADATPLAGEAMAVTTRLLENLSSRGDLADVLHLLTRVVEVAPTLDRTLAMLDSLSELTEDAIPLTNGAMALASDRLAMMQERGYFDFAKAGFGVVDKIVTNFTEDDVEQLGDNVVTMLETVKELTQPEMLALIQHMIEGLQRQKNAMVEESDEAPGLWELFKKMRDPDVRKGMARALNTLGAVSAETGPETMREIKQTQHKGEV